MICLTDLRTGTSYLGNRLIPYTNDGRKNCYTIERYESNEVFSVQQDGSIQYRASGSNGPFEVFQIKDALATVKPFGFVYSFGFMDISELKGI